MSEDTCTCPPGRPLGMDHLPHCPAQGKPDIIPEVHSITTMVRTETGQPIGVPTEIVEQHDLVFRAYQLKLRGKSWDAIAEHLMYPSQDKPSGSAMAKAVSRYLDDGQRVFGKMKRQEFMALALARLEVAVDAVWDEMTNGKPASVMAFLATHDRMVKLVGLDNPDPDEAGGKVTTVVVPNDSQSFVDALREVADQLETAEVDEGDDAPSDPSA